MCLLKGHNPLGINSSSYSFDNFFLTSSLSFFLETQKTYEFSQKLLFVNTNNDRVLGNYLPCKCSKSIPSGAYSKTMILVKGSSSSQYPRRLTKFLWLTFDNVSIWNHNNRNNWGHSDCIKPTHGSMQFVCQIPSSWTVFLNSLTNPWQILLF